MLIYLIILFGILYKTISWSFFKTSILALHLSSEKIKIFKYFLFFYDLIFLNLIILLGLLHKLIMNFAEFFLKKTLDIKKNSSLNFLLKIKIIKSFVFS